MTRRGRPQTLPSIDLPHCRAAYMAGDTLADIGNKYGISREAVRVRFIRAYGEDGYARMKEVHKQSLEVLRAMNPQKENQSVPPKWEGRACRVCGKPITRNRSHGITCSHECAEAWRTLRFYIDPQTHERHRRLVAQRAEFLLGPDERYPLRTALAKGQPAPPPNRRYAWSPRVKGLLEKYGIEVPRVR